MAPRRAEAWPAHMLEDPDVKRLDAGGLFVLCRTCEAYHNVHGGRPPRPVRMTSRFRTRAWEVHKRRNMAHTRDRSWAICVAANRTISTTSELSRRKASTRLLPAAAEPSTVAGTQSQVDCIAKAAGTVIDDPKATPLMVDKPSVGRPIEDASDIMAQAIETVEQDDDPGPVRSQPVVSDSETSSASAEFKHYNGVGRSLVSVSLAPSTNAPVVVFLGPSCRLGPQFGIESLSSGYIPVLKLKHAIEQLTHAISRQQTPHEAAQLQHLAAVSALEELAESVCEMQHEQQQSFQYLFRLQERANRLMQQLMAPEPEQ